MKRDFLYLLSIIILALSCSSNHSGRDRLDKINNICETEPSLALSMLDSLNSNTLSGRDRHYYDFLTIKAYNAIDRHISSDSLILDVIEYFSNETEPDIYPEILLQAGIVYDKLGDKPTALKYLQNSLNLLDNDSEHEELRKNVIGKIGEILYSIRLYGEAEPYLRQSIETAISTGDSLAAKNHTFMLGMIKSETGHLEEAEGFFSMSRNLAAVISPADTLKCDLSLASIASTGKEPDSLFHKLIRKEQFSHDLGREKVFAKGEEVLFRSDIMNAIIQLAKDSSERITPDMAREAYSNLPQELKKNMSEDSLPYYIQKYGNILEKYFTLFLAEPTRFQNAYYNYTRQEREKIIAQQEKAKVEKWLLLSVILMLLLIMIILYLKYRNKSNLLKLHEAFDNLSQLRTSLENKKFSENAIFQTEQGSQDITNGIEINNYDSKTPGTISADCLKERLKLQLLELRKEYTGNYEVPSRILASEAHARLMEFIVERRAIPDKSSLWIGLSNTVEQCCPDFKYHLQLLTGGKLKPNDYHLALLVKCGVTPTQLTFLLARTKGTISYRRQALSIRIFNENLGANAIDDIIRLL